MPLNSSLLLFILRANPLDQAIGGLGEAVYKDELFSPEVGDDHTQVARQPYLILIDLTPSIEYELTTREKGRIRLIVRIGKRITLLDFLYLLRGESQGAIPIITLRCKNPTDSPETAPFMVWSSSLLLVLQLTLVGVQPGSGNEKDESTQMQVTTGFDVNE